MDHLDVHLVVDENDAELRQNLDSAKVASKPLVTKRTITKRAITVTLNKIKSDTTLPPSFILSQLESVKQKLATIEDLDGQITSIYDEHGVLDSSSDFYVEFTTRQTDYQFATQLEVDSLQQLAKSKNGPTASEDDGQSSKQSSASITLDHLNQIMNASGFKAKVHEIKLPIFHGNQNDVLMFSDFLRQFKDLIGDRSEYTPATKLIYLKSYLRGSALDTIKHLSNEDTNYSTALEFLTKEYLDADVIVDRHLQKLVNIQPPQSRDNESLRSFFNVARTSIYELRNHGLDALEEDTLGNKLLSYILYEKLPTAFKNKLSIVIQSDYPSVRQLLDNYNDIIKSLEKTTLHQNKPAIVSGKRDSNAVVNNAQTNRPLNHGNSKPNYQRAQSRAPALQNFKGQVSHSSITHKTSQNQSRASNFKPCKLCSGSHSMLRCDTYDSPSNRIKRLQELGLCNTCSGNHNSKECEGNKNNLQYACTLCNSRRHIGAVCLSLNPVCDTQNNISIFSNTATENKSGTVLPSISAVMGNPTGTQ